MGGSISQREIDRHLELGRDFLARGQLPDALTQYHAAVGELMIIFFYNLTHSVQSNINIVML